MKNIKFILLMFVFAIAAVSCEDDGGSSLIPLDEGIIPTMNKSETGEPILDLLKITNGENVGVAFNANLGLTNNPKPASTDIIGFYKTKAGPIYKTVLFSDVSLPKDFTLSVGDIVAAFTELNSSADFLLGDVLTVTARFTRADGTILNIINDDGSNNISSNLSTTSIITTSIDYPVSCPSDIGGVYNVVSNGASTEPGIPPAVNLPYTVTLTDNGGGSYTISDGVAGVYIYWYTGFGYDFETEGNFTDVCGDLSGSWTEGFSCQIDLTGTVNDDGTLSIHWENCFGDIADAVYTPQ